MQFKLKKTRNIKKQDVERIKTTAEFGLTSAQVSRIRAAGYSNTFSNKSYKTVKQIIFDNVFTFFNLVYIVSSILFLIVRSYKELTFLHIVFSNTLIGIFQQVRSKIKLDKLTLISSPKSVVVRNGEELSVFNHELVRDDVVILKSGDQITADATLIKGEIQVDESLLTGESDPISKATGDMLLSGSFVLSGKCFARLDNVGQDSYAARLTAETKKNLRKPQSDMMNSLDKIIHIISFTMVPIGLILFLKQTFILEMFWENSIKTTVSALMGMIPAGLYLLTSIALIMSAVRLMESKTLVNDMTCIETLARVDVLCVDKTGTITDPHMKVSGLVPLFNNHEEDMEQIVNSVVLNMPPDNSTSLALKQHFNQKSNWKIKKFHPFLSSTKWSAAEFENHGTYIIGAPEFILKEQYKTIEKNIGKYISQGIRVLLVARFDGKIEKNLLIGKKEPVCLILLENPVRKEAPKTFKFFEDQGVKIKVISGDNPLTASKIAKKAKIKNAEKYIDARNLKTENQMRDAIEKYAVFGRVTPDQKRKFIQLLKEKHTVAMTGDGVNDVLALKDSNIGIAMASGSNAASQVAELVLLNSNFASMPKIVMEGRRVINNIERSASLFLVKNIFSFTFSIIALFINMAYPITALQWTLVDMLTIGLPGLLLTLEPTTAIVKGHFITNVLKKALPGGICNLLLILTLQVFTSIFSFKFEELSTMAVFLLATNGFSVLFKACEPFNLKRLAIFFSMLILMIFSVILLSDLFSLINLSIKALVVLICLMALDYPLLKLLEHLTSRLLNSLEAPKNQQ